MSLELAETTGVRKGVSEGWVPRTLDASGKLEVGSSSGVRAICLCVFHCT